MSNEHSSKDNLNKGHQSSIVDHKEISKISLEKMTLIIRHLVLLLVIVFTQLSNFLALESVCLILKTKGSLTLQMGEES